MERPYKQPTSRIVPDRRPLTAAECTHKRARAEMIRVESRKLNTLTTAQIRANFMDALSDEARERYLTTGELS